MKFSCWYKVNQFSAVSQMHFHILGSYISRTWWWTCFTLWQLDRKTLSIAIRFIKAKTPEQRAAVDLDTHYSKVMVFFVNDIIFLWVSVWGCFYWVCQFGFFSICFRTHRNSDLQWLRVFRVEKVKFNILLKKSRIQLSSFLWKELI